MSNTLKFTETVSFYVSVSRFDEDDSRIKVEVETTPRLKHSDSTYFLLEYQTLKDALKVELTDGVNYDDYGDHFSLTTEQATALTEEIRRQLKELDTVPENGWEKKFKVGTYWRYLYSHVLGDGNIYIVSNDDTLVNIRTGGRWRNDRLMLPEHVHRFTQVTQSEAAAFLNE